MVIKKNKSIWKWRFEIDKKGKIKAFVHYETQHWIIDKKEDKIYKLNTREGLKMIMKYKYNINDEFQF